MSLKYLKIIKPYGFYCLEFGFPSKSKYDPPSPIRDRLLFLLNLLAFLVLLPINIIWSGLKITGSLIGMIILYPIFTLLSFVTKPNFSIAHTIRDFFGNECIYLLVDLISIPFKVGLHAIGVFSLSMVEKVTDSDWYYKMNDILFSLEEDALSALKVGVLHLIRPKKLTWYGLNPTELSEDQKRYPPIICVHGYLSCQAAWIPLARFFHETNYPGAIFTIDVPSESRLRVPFTAYGFTYESSEYIQSKTILMQKITEVMASYPEDMKNQVHLIGHSRGSWVTTDVACQLAGQKVQISAISLDNEYNKFSWDTTGHLKICSSGQETHEDTTHTGMLFNREVLGACYQHIIEKSKEWKAARPPGPFQENTYLHVENQSPHTGISMFPGMEKQPANKQILRQSCSSI